MKGVLVLNAGSSSLKFALFPLNGTLAEKPALSGQVEGIGTEPHLLARDADGARYDEAVAIETGADQSAQHKASLARLFDWLARHNPNLDIIAAGHRVVHGGETFSAPTRIDGDILTKLDAFVPLAPLHQPHNLRAIRSLAELMPAVPQVACFDTAFHRTQPALAQMFALPRELSEEGIKRYGFHGQSYDYVNRQLPGLIGERAKGGVVIAHLGNGSSMCALRGGRSVASSMGFTAVDGLMMGTRTGNLDPGVLLYLMEQKGMDLKSLTTLLYKQSGLLGVSGISQDMRELLESDALPAREAVELYCYRAAREIGSLAAAAGGLDALVFTGGIGEHAAPVREKICRLSAWLGIELDAAANERSAVTLSSAASRVTVLAVPTNEEWMIAHHTVALLGL
ncbi:MAG: acetate/propionate family kinase [Rhodocyclaceae bacterium]|nr:acetate/propionate family kinase [Rhodocyclaceae bacterium]